MVMPGSSRMRIREVGKRSNLSSRQQIETIVAVVLINKDLGSLFGRNRLLDVVGKYLTKGQVGSYVDVRRSNESIWKIMNPFNIKT